MIRMSFGPNTPIQPTPVPSRNPPSEVVDDRGEFTDGEVAAMNRQYREDERFWRDEHQ